MSAHSSKNAPANAGASIFISGGRFRRACREIGLASRLEQALLIRRDDIAQSDMTQDDIVMSDWAAESKRAVAIAGRVRSTWTEGEDIAQIQYVTFANYDAPLLLMTTAIGDSLLTLVALSAMAISRLRRIGDELTGRLLLGDDGPTETMVPGVTGSASAYAIAWRPLEPLPAATRNRIRQDVHRLARENGCHLSFVGVASDHVHLVLDCPSHKSSSWAAYAFKRGTEEQLALRDDKLAAVWRKGYLACPSTEPLAGEELLVYLSSSV